MASPVRKNVKSSKVKLSPILERSQTSSKIMDRNIKKIESVIYQKEQPIVLSNLKISKEVTITNLVKSEPVVKVPDSSKFKINNNNKNNTTHNKIKVLFKKKGLSERRNDNTEAKDNLLSHNNINISDTNLNPSRILKPKPKQTFNNISLVTKSSDKGIIKNSEVSYKKYPVSEKENFQRTTSPKKLSKKRKCSSNIQSKSSKIIKLGEELSINCKNFTKEVKQAEKKISNNCNIFSKEVKPVSDKDTIISSTEFKTNELDNENYMLMDLSTDGQFNIVPASFPLDFINDGVSYENFIMGISKSSEVKNMHLETSQNDTEKGLIIIKKELDNFSDFLDSVNSSINVNELDLMNNLMDSNIPIQQILPNNIVNSSNLKSDVDEKGIKRKQFENDLSLCERLKKQKII